ncbi:MFS transporter [Dactylosporangium sp. CS-033363]|uniref:MFS transporter n=1 Tax=Dactylosporangium sp. CS-033363 TaxID=3239935 RepID=UPI003D8B1F55
MRDERRLSRPARWFVAGYGISAVGTGLCYPYLALYLHDVRGLPATASAALLLLLAGVAVPASLYGGGLADRRSPRSVALAALVAQAAGWLLLGAAPHPVAQAAALVVIGAGTGLFLPAVVPVVAALSPSEAVRARTMSLRYLLLNLGLGAGGAIGGLLLDGAGPGVYHRLFAANGASCLAYAAIVLLLVPVGPAPARGAGEVPARFRPGFDLALLFAAELLLVTFGLAQVESGVPLAVREQLHGSTRLVGLLFALGTAVVLVAQLPVARWVERVHKTRALAGMALAWAGAWLLGLVASAAGERARPALLVVVVVGFALGECAYSPAFYTLVERLAPPGALGRASGAAWAVFQAGNTAGPPIAVLVVAGGVSLWPILAAAAVGAAGLLLVLDRRQHRGRVTAPVVE